jgi:hypothetical protein
MRNSYLIILLAVTTTLPLGCTAQIPNKDQQITEAVMAAPEEKRAEATVMGFNDKGELVLIKLGTNEMICLADDPNKDGFSVACYHKDLEPFMAKGRSLKSEGKTTAEIFDIRAKEVKDGILKMPSNPAALHILSGADLASANIRYVVYIPFATPESTGLPVRPLVPGGPWIMDPGTHRAHIMISPPAPEK